MPAAAPAPRRLVVVKVGTSSVTDEDGRLDDERVRAIAAEVTRVRAAGHRVILVASGAVAAGLPMLGMSSTDRPRDPRTLQAVAAVGQIELMTAYSRVFAQADGTVCGQVLVDPHDFIARNQYLHARATLERFLDLGVLPVVNENDTVTDTRSRFGDNDRIAALVAQAVGADLLVLLTDTAGVLTADPRLEPSASLIDEIVEFDRELEAAVGPSASNRGSGGMMSKIAAARMASWCGVTTLIADASRPSVLLDGIGGAPQVGTLVRPRSLGLSARKVWIAFAVAASGRVVVDEGARAAVMERGASLLAAGVREVEGDFGPDDGIEIFGPDGRPFSKGLARIGAEAVRNRIAARGSAKGGRSNIVVHRDDLVVMPA